MASDPLPSWSEGTIKSAILDFVSRVTADNGPDFVAPEDRIATFDNDGTLWCERPLQTQVYFARYRMEELIRSNPALKEQDPYRAFAEHDRKAIMALGKKRILEFLAELHAGMTEDEFADIAEDWIADARNPERDKRFLEMVYKPQLELLAYLRAKGFSTFIVSGGGVDFIRAFALKSYGIEPAKVIGSANKVRFEMRDGVGVVVKDAELAVFDDREVKVASIAAHIGRRPILAFGNSDGDLAMLRYTLTGDYPSLGLLLHHDDADREFAYDREFKLSPLADALDHADDYGISVVSMKRDWNTVFP